MNYLANLFAFFLIVCLVHSFQMFSHPYRKALAQHQYLSMSTTLAVKPGQPVVKEVNKGDLYARIVVALSSSSTQKAFSDSCELFNQEVRSRGYTVPGFRAGSKLPPQYLYQMFGEEQVKGLCASLLGQEIQNEVDRAGLQLVGRGRVVDFRVGDFEPGRDHAVEIECDLWPEISYQGEGGYRGLAVEVVKSAEDGEKIEKVRDSIKEKYKISQDTPEGYEAVLGDVLTINMQGYDLTADGRKGERLPDVAKGESVEMALEKGKFMEGMVDSLVGAKKGETRDVKVKFPVRAKGPGAALSGKEAVFEVEVLQVKKQSLPQWNGELAARIRDGMTLEELEQEILKAVEGDASSTLEAQRNDALAKVLLDIVQVNKLPKSLIEENTQLRFRNMLMDFKEQGSTDEQLQEMSSPENYEKYKQLSLKNVEKTVKLGLVFRDISEREKITVAEKEIQEQIDLLNAQAKQKGEGAVDPVQAREEIENVLLRKKIFEFLASNAKITYKEAETPISN